MVEGVENLNLKKRGRFCGRAGAISTGVGVEWLESGEDWVGGIGDVAHGAALSVVFPVVLLASFLVPGVAVDLLAESAEVVIVFVVEVEFGPFAFLSVEAVGGGAEADGGAATLEVVDECISLVVGEGHEAGVEEEKVGFFKGFDVGDGGAAAFDVAVFIDAEEDGAFKTVMLGENFGDEGAGFFRAVFVVVCDEDDVLALSGAFSAFEGERCGHGEGGGGY